MEVKSYDEIYNDMKNWIIAHQDKLTDFNDGGVLTSQIEATARELSLAYISCRVGFSSWLRALPYSVFGFEPKNGEKAAVDVVFSRVKPCSFDTNIQKGSIVSAGGLNFLTTETGTILSGAVNSAPIPAIAEELGDKYNVPLSAVKAITSILPSDIVKVNNPSPATGGENAEDWAAYVDRFADFIIGLQRTNSAGYLTGLKNIVRSKGEQEHFPPLDGLWNVTLYLEDGSGGMTNEALAEAKRIIDGNMAKEIGGFRAPGINIQYKTPEKVPITIRATVRTERDVASEVDQSVVGTQVKEAVQKYINGLKIGQSVCTSDLIIVLKRLPSLSDAHITFPKEDIPILFNQIARYEDCIVTVES
jgi:hypothetical protein